MEQEGASILIGQLAKTDLLVLDDWGLEKMNLSQRNDLLEIMEDRHGVKSSQITSQLPIDQWHKAIGDTESTCSLRDRKTLNEDIAMIGSCYSGTQ